jgi:hypothetical protein
MLNWRCIAIFIGGLLVGMGTASAIPPVISLFETLFGTSTGAPIAVLVGGAAGGFSAVAEKCKKQR